MQAVIMAAGSSTRTYPITATRPKPLVPIWDRPLLEHQLRQLEELAEEAILVVGFLREQIEARFGSRFGRMRLRYVLQERQRGTADALLAARPHLTGRTLVLNGDDFYHRDDLRGLADTGRGLLVTRARDPQNRAVVEIRDELVTDILEKPRNPPKDAWCSVGGYCIEAEDLARLDDLPLSPRGELELPDFIMRLVRDRSVRPRRIARFWLPLTYAWDVLGAILFLWEDPARARELGVAAQDLGALRRRTDLVIGTDVRIEGPAWIGPNARLGDGVRLVGPIAIGPGCTLGARAVVERAVLLNDIVLGEEAGIADSVLGAGVRVGAGARLESRPGSSLEITIQKKVVVPELERLGAIAGDGAEIAPGAIVPAGSVLPPSA
jgi:bifunctional UDP-N-acetylglucosamine pyrophosphorylase/glucosamine-1-phosphate N-acetyltransferase